MATAAPPAAAAPSAGAPTAQPTTDGTPVATETPAASPAKSAKPIPGPRLPGVFPDDDPFPPPPSAASPSSPDETATPGRQRGPDGRFVSGASPDTNGIGEHTPEPATQPSQSFKIAGEEHESQAAFEQQYKSLKGQYKPIQTLARSLGGVDKIVPHLSRAAESARGWKAEAERLQAELSAARTGQPTTNTPTPQADGDGGDTAAPTVDWDLYAEVRKLANEQGEPWKADQWLQEQMQKVVDARVARLLDERLAPHEQQQQVAEVYAHTENLFTSLAGYTNEDGSVSYPELADEQASYEIGRLWATLGLPPESALTPQGAVAAIGLYRMARGSQARATTMPPPAQRAPVAPPTPTDTVAAASLDDGRQRTATVAGEGSPSAEAARILTALRTTNAGSRAALGFDA